MKKAAIVVEAVIRGFIARRRYVILKRTLPKYAAPIIQKLAKQFIVRFIDLFFFFLTSIQLD